MQRQIYLNKGDLEKFLEGITKDLEYAIKAGAKYEILKTQSPLLPLEKMQELFIENSQDRSAKDKLLTHIHDILEERGTHSELLNAIAQYKNGKKWSVSSKASCWAMAKQISTGVIGGTLIGISEYLNGLDEESKKTAERFYPDTMAHIGYGFVAGSLGSITSNLYRPYSFMEKGYPVLDKLVKAGLQLNVPHQNRETLINNLIHDQDIKKAYEDAFKHNIEKYDLNDERFPMVAENSLANLKVESGPISNISNAATQTRQLSAVPIMRDLNISGRGGVSI